MIRLIFILTIAFITCGTAKGSSDFSLGADTVVVFSDHIKLMGEHSEDFGGSSFNPISIYFDSKLIFKDSLNEYWLTGYESKQYPKLLLCGDGSCQLLIEVDERPNNNELNRFSISKFGMLNKTDCLYFFGNQRTSTMMEY